MSNKAPQEIKSESWAGEVGDKWDAYHEQFESMIEAAGAAVIEHAQFQTHEKVIDVGCGAGITSLLIADIVKDGHITGLDLSETLVNTCKSRAKTLDLNNVDFIAADAQTVKMEGYDHLFSRFGIMFFEDPYKAFANMYGFLKEGGSMTVTCWGAPSENPWMFELMGVIKNHVELPAPTPNAPGPFAFADTEYFSDILTKAGFKDIEFTLWCGKQYLGGKGASPESATDFLINATSFGEAFENEPNDVKENIRSDLISKLTEIQTDEGIPAKGTTWLVKAKK